MPFIYFAILILLVILSHIQIVLTVALFLFIVPGLVLVASNTALVYSLLLLPAYRWRQSIRRWPVLALPVLAPVALVAIVWPAASQAHLEAFAAAQAAGDFDRWQRIPIKTLALASNDVAWQRRDENEQLCLELCQRLLFDHAVDKVVVASWGRFLEPGATAYRIVLKPDCDALHGSNASYLIAAVRARIAAGECLTEERNADAETVDATAIEERLRIRDGLLFGTDPREGVDRQLFKLTHRARVSLKVGGPHGGRSLFRRTAVAGAALTMPFVIWTGADESNIQLQIVRTPRAFNAIDLETALTQKIGLHLPPVSPEQPALVKVE
jgi:hypothetical protein